MSAPVLSRLLSAQGEPRRAFLIQQFSPCTSPLSTARRQVISFCSARTSEQGPPYSTLRANPFPEVTDKCCRLPLPTFYGPEAANLGDLMRLWVRPRVRISLSFGFSRAVGSTGYGANKRDGFMSRHTPWPPSASTMRIPAQGYCANKRQAT